MSTSIPLVDIAAQSAEISEDLRPDIDRVLATGGFIGGKDVSEFESEYAALCGVRFCVGMANGTDAVELALRAAGVIPGDDVIIPANTFIATAEAVARCGATPVLVDVDPDTLLIDVEAARRAVGPRTRVILPVHLYGQMAPMEDLLAVAAEAGVLVVEDAAQSQGATRNGRTSGAFGALAATSFYPGKNLGAAGDAGAVTTDDPELATAVRLLGNHGSPAKYVHDVIGFNSRLDAIQAVVLRHKLQRLAGWNKRRREIADGYLEALADLSGVQLPVVAEGNEAVWHLFVVQVDDRDRVLAALNAAGIGAGIHYPTPIHLTGAFAHLGHGRGDFPVTEAAADRILSLPIYPHLSPADQTRVIDEFRAALGAARPDHG